MPPLLVNTPPRVTVIAVLKKVFRDRRTWYLALAVLAFLLLILMGNSAPSSFPVRTIISIEEGESLADVSRFLKERQVIRSEVLFEFFVITRGGEHTVMAGDYFFTEPKSAFTLARRFTRGEFGIAPVKVTVPEGLTAVETAATIKRYIADFDEGRFIELVREKEGYLFPDTYFLLPTTSPEEVISIMGKNFERRTSSLAERVEASGKPLADIVTMASIIEREVMNPEDRRIVSGILWKRLSIGMPLQVDATFVYVNGTTTPGLSLRDLKIDSPYNTYLYRGLPKGPIGNPGLDALMAAFEPIATPYLYYLSDKNGVTHYAKDFEEHKKNKEKYLW